MVLTAPLFSASLFSSQVGGFCYRGFSAWLSCAGVSFLQMVIFSPPAGQSWDE